MKEACACVSKTSCKGHFVHPRGTVFGIDSELLDGSNSSSHSSSFSEAREAVTRLEGGLAPLPVLVLFPDPTTVNKFQYKQLKNTLYPAYSFSLNMF